MPNIAWPSPFEVLKTYGLAPRKSFSQNFLRDASVAERLAQDIPLDPDEDRILEIGPGTGAMTYFLLERVKTVIGLEKDTGMVTALREIFKDSPLEIIPGDALTFDYNSITDASKTSLRVTGNLPYGITAPLLRRLLEVDPPWRGIHVLLQKEVAQKMQFSPGDRNCSPLGILLQWRYRSYLGVQLPPSSFIPKPDVDSQVLHLIPRQQSRFPGKLHMLERLLGAAFSQRRKKMANNLSVIGVAKADAPGLLESAGLPVSIRAEAITMEQWGKLYDVLLPYLEPRNR